MKRVSRIAAPLIAVAVIALCWAYALGWFAPPQDAEGPQPLPKVATEAPPPLAEPRAGGGQDWSTYHGGATLTGAVDTTFPERLVRLWVFQADSAVQHAPVSCGDGLYFATRKGSIHALDMAGKEVWSKALVRGIREDGSPIPDRIEAPVACFDSTLIAATANGTLHAFDAATGGERWTYEVGGPVLGTVTLHRATGRVFVLGQGDGSLHCVDLESGAPLWRSESIDRCDGSPAAGEKTIVFGSCAAALHVVSVEDGSLVRNIPIDGDSQVAGGVALAGDSVFSGSYSGKLIHANAKTGEILWINEDSEDEIFTTPAVDEDSVVYGSFDGGVYALDRETGEQRWKFETDGIPTSPVIAGGSVAVGSDGTLYLLSLKTGEELWSYEVSDEISSPAIIGGMIVVGSADGTVTAFGAG